MTFAIRKRRNWLRGILALAAIAAAFTVPATAAAMTPSSSSVHLAAWADESSEVVAVSFTSHKSYLFGQVIGQDKIDTNDANLPGTWTGDTAAFALGIPATCIKNAPTSDCTAFIRFDAPETPAKPVYHATLRIFSTWDGAQYDGVVEVFGYAGVKGATGQTGGQGIQGPQGPQGPGCIVKPVLDGEQGEQGPTGPQGDPGNVFALNAEENGDDLPNSGDVFEFPECPKGDKGDKGEPGTNGTNGTNGATGAQGPKGDTGATGAPGLDAPASANTVVTKVKYVTVRSSCMVKRNARTNARVAHCLVKVPKGTPNSTWTLMAGKTRIGTGSIKAGVREFRVTKALPKTVGGWVTVLVSKPA